MKKTERLNVEFGALRILKIVHDLESFSRAAMRLDMRQSRVSQTIGRLRRIFNDPLFVRTSSGVMPTERCEAIMPAITRLLDRFDSLAVPRNNVPGHAEFDVTMAISHQHRTFITSAMLSCLREKSPGVRLRIRRAAQDSHEALLAGNCDLLITSVPYGIAALHRRHLFMDRYVCVMDREHPAAKQKCLTLTDYAAASHILLGNSEAGHLPYIAALDRLRLPFRVVLDLPSISAVEEFLRGTDLIATMAERSARCLSSAVAIVDPPFNHLSRVDMYWTRRTEGLENMRWIRNLVVEAVNRTAF